MRNNENQFCGVLPAVKFYPCTYRQYIEKAKKLYLLNIEEVETYLAQEYSPRADGLNLAKYLEYFFGFCLDLLNQDCQHGNYRPDPLETELLLSWMKVTKELHKKLADRILVEEDLE